MTRTGRARSALDAYDRMMATARMADEIRLLGTVEVVVDGAKVDIGGPKQKTVLAALVARHRERVSTDALVEAVYGTEPPERARRSIQTDVYNLRQILGDTIRPESDGYVLESDRFEIDAERFTSLLREGHELLDEDPAGAADKLRAALRSWRGHPYADVDGSTALTGHITALNEARLDAISTRIDADLALGRHTEILPELQALAAEHPLSERLRAQHMLALYRAGRQAEALRAYEATRRYLGAELGIDPSPQLRDLENQILTQDPSLEFERTPTVARRAVLTTVVDQPDDEASGGGTAHLMLAADASIRRAVGDANGEVVAQRATATLASFSDISDAFSAASAIAHAGDGETHLIRTAVDMGDVRVDTAGRLGGPTIVRAGALAAAAHPGQVVVSETAHAEAIASRAAGWTMRALGPQRLASLEEEVPVYQLVVDGLPSSFPPLSSDAVATDLTTTGAALPGYELREEIGRGRFGVVHVGYQPSVGREVAIKVIAPSLADDAEFIRRFELEAMLIARLDHPNILPVIDFWREPGAAYLVTQLIRGGSLATLLESARTHEIDIDRLVRQIGGALAAAHHTGVVHGDVAPRNVLVDGSGNFYLADFGVAAHTGADGASPRNDLGNFARMVAVALGAASGSFEGPREIVEAAARGRDYDSMDEFLAAWASETGTAPLGTYHLTRNPYKGLRAFHEHDAVDFHGREREIDAVLAAVQRRRFVAVVGPSGIGKSSIVRAGVLPRLRNRTPDEADGAAPWFVTTMTPGGDPFAALMAALRRISRQPVQPIQNPDRRAITRAAVEATPTPGHLLLIIDQFEEMFTLTPESMRDQFLGGLVDLVEDPHGRTTVLATLRADFYDRPLLYPGLGELLDLGTIAIGAPDSEAMRAIIRRPAANVGVTVEEAVVERIESEVRGQSTSLPLMEFALTEMFADRRTDVVTTEDFDRIGGIRGSIGRFAEHAFDALDDIAKPATRDVMLRLVTVDDTGGVTRRRAALGELTQTERHRETVDQVLDEFTDRRLLTSDRDEVTRVPTAEVTHEAIFSEWPRLAAWIDERRESLIMRSRLTALHDDWVVSGNAPEYLLAPGRLEQHESWIADGDIPVADEERAFVTASRAAADEAMAARRRRRRGVLAVLVGSTVVAAILGVFAWVQRDTARTEEVRAEASALTWRVPGAVGMIDPTAWRPSARAAGGPSPYPSSTACSPKPDASIRSRLALEKPSP